jgi:hypothetical protein
VTTTARHTRARQHGTRLHVRARKFRRAGRVRHRPCAHARTRPTHTHHASSAGVAGALRTGRTARAARGGAAGTCGSPLCAELLPGRMFALLNAAFCSPIGAEGEFTDQKVGPLGAPAGCVTKFTKHSSEVRSSVARCRPQMRVPLAGALRRPCGHGRQDGRLSSASGLRPQQCTTTVQHRSTPEWCWSTWRGQQRQQWRNAPTAAPFCFPALARQGWPGPPTASMDGGGGGRFRTALGREPAALQCARGDAAAWGCAGQQHPVDGDEYGERNLWLRYSRPPPRSIHPPSPSPSAGPQSCPIPSAPSGPAALPTASCAVRFARGSLCCFCIFKQQGPAVEKSTCPWPRDGMQTAPLPGGLRGHHRQEHGRAVR